MDKSSKQFRLEAIDYVVIQNVSYLGKTPICYPNYLGQTPRNNHPNGLGSSLLERHADCEWAAAMLCFIPRLPFLFYLFLFNLSYFLPRQFSISSPLSRFIFFLATYTFLLRILSSIPLFLFFRWLGFISFLQLSTVSELCPQSRIGFTAYIHSFLPNANTSSLVMLFYHLQGILRNLHRDKTFLSWNLPWYDDHFVTAEYWIFLPFTCR